MTATQTSIRTDVSSRRRQRVLTGDRPTGPLHLGHYFGTVANRVRLQSDGADLFVVVADYQVITDRELAGDLRRASLGLVLDYLACGLDPEHSTVFAHSAVPELNQLVLPFLSLVTMGELDRNPTVKEEIRLAGRATVSGLMMTYPVHQAADILFCKADLVPVGRDQLPHLEVTRSIARRFAERYGPVFTVPDGMLSDTPVLAGLDGRKMAKSQGNAIALSDPPDVVAGKVRAARTDSERRIAFDPVHRPEVSNLLTLAGLCEATTPHAVADRIGSSGAAALKTAVIDAVNAFLAPIRARRAMFDEADAARVLAAGNARARDIAVRTLDEVRSAMGMDYRVPAITR